jgi:SAM-dependent methyltransferase
MRLVDLTLIAPTRRPERVLDYGSGPATALLALDAVYPNVMVHAAAIEPSTGMQSIGEQLLGDRLRRLTSYNRYDVPKFRGGISGEAPELPYGQKLPEPTHAEYAFCVVCLRSFHRSHAHLLYT